ncbi:MAG: protocatechuate 3,4-dioxygenase [Rickettsiales bacterium]
MNINKSKFTFINFFLLIFFCFFDLYAQKLIDSNPLASEADPEQNFELKKIYQLSYDKKELYGEDLSPFKPKVPTPSRLFTADLSMPETFQSTNNLAKKPGSFYRAYGEIIFIQGTLTDSFGVPIHNAVIEIWQTNSAGKYHTLLESGSGYIDKFFSMSGRAISDNLGNYHFISIMPGATSGRAPHINMNVYHPRFGKLETEIYFMNHPFNFTDYQYLSYPEEDRKLITAEVRNTDILNPKSIKIVTFNITMKGIHQYKKF